jgi:hypothetical protein
MHHASLQLSSTRLFAIQVLGLTLQLQGPGFVPSAAKQLQGGVHQDGTTGSMAAQAGVGYACRCY